MLKDERLERIVEYINANRYASIAELVKEFGISRATIHRDLERLQQARRVSLTRGGASSINKGTSFELPYMEKLKHNLEEKTRIAKAACARIQAGETVLIDSGTTGYQMTHFLENARDVHIATNDLVIAVALAACPNIHLIMIGGSIRHGFYTADGHFAAASVENYHFDKVFLCLDSLHVRHGGMITNTDEVDVKRSMIKSSSEVIAICDHTKFDIKAFVTVCPLDRIDLILTGKELSDDIYREYVDAGVRIERV